MTQAFNLSQFANNVNSSGLASLTTGVTGTLPIGNGGTNSTATAYCSLTTNVSGVLPVANGGTGTATPAIVAGTNITVSESFPNQTINATSSAPSTAFGAIGTYVVAESSSQTSSGTYSVSSTVAGSTLRRHNGASSGTSTFFGMNGTFGNPPFSCGGTNTSYSLSGTWQRMGTDYTSGGGGYGPATLWIRIS